MRCWRRAILHAVDAVRDVAGGASSGARSRWPAAVTLQAALGITTLLAQAPLGLALMHQAMAMIVLTLAVLHARAMARRKARDPPNSTPDPADELGAAARG